MRWLWPFWLILLGTLPGCVVIKVGVQNPVPGLTTVAIVPFYNLSQEPNQVVDGRRFALSYYAELQKTPGFEVIPVGVAESAMLQHDLDLRNPDDALKLCQLLKADAVVVGAVTDYDPYYPPRIGLQVDWYSPYPWYDFNDGTLYLEGKAKKPGKGDKCPPGQSSTAVVRGQNPDVSSTATATQFPQPPVQTYFTSPEATSLSPEVDPGLPSVAAPAFDPRKPLMSYTRLFDGADSDLVNKLRDYLELRGDLRGGGWEATLQRSEDFIRFTSHVMIVEMLSLHGGAVKSQIVLKWRKYR